MIKKVFISLGCLFLLVFILNYELIFYGLKMGYNQINIVYEAVEMEEVLENPSTSDSVRAKMELIKDVRRFSIDSLGLKDSENYTTFYDQKGEVSLWNLSASEVFAFEPIEWSFPIAGTFPYKGFFDLEDAKSEGRKLKQSGYDVRIRPVGGWSTLGWFKDPILSNMLERSEGELVNLIIHELTHSTLFVKDNIELSENLATFVADIGTTLYLKNKFGEKSKEYMFYVTDESDSKLFMNHMLNGAKKLDSLYKSFKLNQTDSIKRKLKQTLIDSIVSKIDTLPLYDKSRFEGLENYKPNNAHFMSFLRYNSKQNEFMNEYKTRFNSDFHSYMNYLKKGYSSE